MLEEDLRAHHMTLKAMKDQLEAKLERLKVCMDLVKFQLLPITYSFLEFKSNRQMSLYYCTWQICRRTTYKVSNR